MGISSYIAALRKKIGDDLLLLPSVGAIMFNDRGELLLQRARDDGKWYVIGGAMEPHEQPADAIVREVLEETGLHVKPTRIICIETSPVVTYPNGHQVQYVGTTFLCEIIGGELKVNDDESLEFRYFAPNALPELRPDQLRRVQYALGGRESASFEPSAYNR
jgi:8-oxo-dGTP diphosphatase